MLEDDNIAGIITPGRPVTHLLVLIIDSCDPILHFIVSPV